VIPLLLFLLACAAIYVASVRAAFTSLMRLSLRFMAERNGRADVLSRYLDDPIGLFLPARLLLILIFVAAAVLLVDLIGYERPRDLAILAASLLGFALVCENAIPQIIVRRDPQAVLETLLPSFDVVAAVMRPLCRAMAAREGAAGRHGAVRTDEPGGDEREGAELPGEGETSLAGEEERRLLRAIVGFGERLVREVMTPRPDVVAIPAEATIDDLRALVREEQYSRIPVYKENLDNIVGIVFTKDLLQIQGTDAEAGQGITRLARAPYFVPETKRVPELLKEFQRKQVQLAIVVDEYGGTAGLVTFEDLLEEIVGEIRDEYDVETEPIVEETDGVYLFGGGVHIDDVAARLQVDIEGEGFETVGGYLLTHLGRVPAVGETLEIDGLQVEVLEAERRRINRVRIRRAVAASEADRT